MSDFEDYCREDAELLGEPAALQRLEPPPSYKLHPMRGPALAAFLGTPIAAAIVLAINYWRMDKKVLALFAVPVGIVVAVVAGIIVLSIPRETRQGMPSIVFYAPQVFLVHLMAVALQGKLIRSHIARGGAVASGWPSLGIGLACFAGMICLLLATLPFFGPWSYGRQVEFGPNQVFCVGQATDEDAHRLARRLQEIGFFGTQGSSVQLRAESEHYTVSFITGEAYWEDAATVDAFRAFGRDLAHTEFGFPLTVQLCDGRFTPQTTIEINEPQIQAD